MSFQSLSAEISGVLSGISPFLSDTYINRAYRDILNARLWSFLQEDAGIVCPTQVTAGAVAITQFAATVTCDATASAALLAISLPSPLDLTALQIRFGGTGSNGQVGQVYSISAFDDTTPTAVVLTLDRIVLESTNATASYQCYRCYITPTVDDFLKWQSIVDMVNAWALRLDRSSSAFDLRDPQRTAQGLAYYVGAFKGSPETQARPQYELWPHPTSGQTFYARYRRRGAEFVAPTDTQPLEIADALIVSRAMAYYAFPWAAANVGRFPLLKGTNWIEKILDEKKNYQSLLLDAKRLDDEQELSGVWARGHGLRTGRPGFKGLSDYPIDANFMQSHLVRM